MAKAVNKDSQILLNILRIQNDMSDIVDEFEDAEELAADKKSYDLMYFYALKIIGLTKYLHNKTKKESLGFLNPDTNKLLQTEIEVCYPTISKVEVMEYALTLCDDVAKIDVRDRYSQCIEKSPNYGGSTQ